MKMSRLLLFALGVMMLNSAHADRLYPPTRAEAVAAQISEFPWQEGFEDCGTDLPAGWSLEHVNGTLDWFVGNGGHDSEHKVNIPFGNGPVTRLVSPTLDLSSLSNPVLKFYRMAPAWGTVVDVLRVYYRTAPNAEWQLLKVYDEAAADWSECILNLVNASSQYQVAFEAELKFANGISLDDIRVEQAAPAPVISGANPMKLGSVYNNLPWPHKATYTVKNSGSLPLTVSSVASASDGMEVSGLPAVINSLETADLHLTLDANSLPEGPYSGSFSLASDDPLTPEYTVNVTGEVTAAVITNYIEEDFNGSDPKGWGTVACSKLQDGGVDGSGCIRALLHQNQPQGGVQTCYVQMGANPSVSLYYKVLDYATNQAAAAGAMEYAIYVSKDGGATFDALTSGKTAQTDGYVEIKADAKAYAGELCLVQIVFEPAVDGENWLYIDDITVGTKPANEMGAVAISGDRIPESGKQTDYTVTVQNNGSNAQSDYEVALMSADNTLISSAKGYSIAPGEQRSFKLAWTPAEGGPQSVYGKVILATDEYAVNDRTQPYKVFVRDNSTGTVQIGDGDKKIKYPYNLSTRESLTQTLYLANEIGTNGGDIHALRYNADITSEGSNLQDVGIEIWLGETDKDNLKDGWIDPSTLTKVYDGILSFPAGQYDIAVPLDCPYTFRGGNLVVYSHRKDSYNGVYTDNFTGTDMPGSYRSIQYSTFVSGISPMAPPAFSEGEHGIPNTTFVMDQSGKGAVRGVVSDTNGVISGAEVRIAGTQLYTLTDEKGCFSFSSLNSGFCSLQVNKYGYNTAYDYFAINTGEDAVRDIVLTPRECRAITGTVTGPSGSDPLEGAKVSLTGYADYSTLTDKEGKFSFPEVYSGLSYTMEVRLKGYETYTTSADLYYGDMEMNIRLSEKAYPVSNLSATATDEGAVVTWELPVGYEAKSYVYDDGTFETGWRNTNAGLTSAFGTLFNEGESGEVISVDLYGLAPQMGQASPTRTLTVELFDADRQLLAESEPFILPANDWITVPFDNVPYNGQFYVMVKWSASNEGDSNFLGYDQDGPYASAGTDYYYDDNLGWTTVYAMSEGIRGTMMIRANVEADGMVYAAGRRIVALDDMRRIPVPTQYKVFRLTEGADRESWEELTVTTGQSYTDTAYPTLADGLYRYAVTAIYYGEQESAARLSGQLAKGLDMKVTVTVATNNGIDSDGALVTLTSNDNPEEFTYTGFTDGAYIEFPAVRKGTYTLGVTLPGYETYEQTDLEISENRDIELTLKEAVVTPYGLNVKEGDNDTHIFSWNNDPAKQSRVSYWKEPNYSNLQSLYEKKGDAYGVVFDLTGYKSAKPVKMDFYNAPWGHEGPSKYRVIVTDNDNYQMLYRSDVLETTVENDWESDIPVEVQEDMAGKHVGIFIEPLSGSDDDAAPVLSADRISPNAHSCRLNTISMGTNLISGQQNFSEFLLNLWVETEDGEEPAVSKVKPVFTVYLDDMEQTTTTATSHEFKDLRHGAHKAGVKATYTTDETPVVTLDFNVETTGTATVECDGISLGVHKSLIHYLNASDIEVTSLQVVNASGLVVYSAENPTPGYIDPKLVPGCYLVILRNDDSMVTCAKVYLNR